jgi:hypothetical protein
MASTIEYAGMTVNELVGELTKAGVTASETNVIAAGWILENVGRLQRTFNYHEPFPASIPACVPAPFVRTFVHANWVDGEDVVQAGDANGKEGFNSRFHKIEADIDRLGADLGQTAQCLANLRASLRKILDEIRAEINVIHRELHDCCHSGLIIDPGLYRGPRYGMIDTGKFLGTSKVLGKTVSIWETKQGMITLPAIEYMGVEFVGGPRVTGAGKISGLIHENPQVREFAQQPFKVRDLVQKFGDVDMGEGVLVVDVVDVLPRNAKYENWDAMVGDIAERNAAFMRTNDAARSAVATALGFDQEKEEPGKVAIERLDTIPKKARVVLAKNGITTLEELSARKPAEIAEMMKREELDHSVGATAGWIGQAQTLVQLGKGHR